MNNINRVINIDGVPGITLEGRKGETGKNGGMLFFTDGTNNNLSYSVFDIWPNDYVSNHPSFIDKRNFCDFTIPAVNDYILTHIQNIAYVYIINVFIDKSSIVKKDLSKYIERGEITEEYADSILAYYSEDSHTTNDCCLVTEISSLSYFSNISNNIFEMNIFKVFTDVNYTAYTGNLVGNTSQPIPETGIMGTTETSAQFAFFNIIMADTHNMENIRVEAEFYTNNISGEMCSIYPALWSGNSTNILSKNYPMGYLENYDYKINYDSENLENFTVIIKDFGENGSNGKKIPLQAFSGYTICIYAYVPEDITENTNITVLNKVFITEIDGDSIISL